MIKLHKMTWEIFNEKMNPVIKGKETGVIPESYYFNQDGVTYFVDKGAVGWNIYNTSNRETTYCETLKELRQYGI